MVLDETMTLVMGVILGFAAVVVYELKYIIAIERKMTKLLGKLEAMEAQELKELLRLDKGAKKKSRK